MSEPSTGAANGSSYDADILAEVSSILQDCACLHHALTELLGDAQEKAAAAQSSAHFKFLSAQLCAHSAKLGAAPNIRDDGDALTHRAAALQALACADHANALHHIALCDAEAERLIGQRCSMDDLYLETRDMLLLVHRILRQASLLEKRPGRSSP